MQTKTKQTFKQRLTLAVNSVRGWVTFQAPELIEYQALVARRVRCEVFEANNPMPRASFA